MSRYNRCKECYNMKCVFVTGEREDFDTSECPDFRPLTNADRIRQMSDEELAEWVTTVGRTFGEEYEGYMSLLDWLKAEASE